MLFVIYVKQIESFVYARSVINNFEIWEYTRTWFKMYSSTRLKSMITINFKVYNIVIRAESSGDSYWHIVFGAKWTKYEGRSVVIKNILFHRRKIVKTTRETRFGMEKPIGRPSRSGAVRSIRNGYRSVCETGVVSEKVENSYGRICRRVSETWKRKKRA